MIVLIFYFFLSVKEWLQYIHYDDLNTFTKKIKNSLYKYSLPENPTLLTVPEKKI